MEPLELPPATFVESPHTGQSSQLVFNAYGRIDHLLQTVARRYEDVIREVPPYLGSGGLSSS